jgi:phosphotriesterase-related protein
VDTAIEEAMWFKKAGGDSIVDVSSIGLRRDPRALLAISQATGLNIVMGAGYYIGKSHPVEIREKSKEEIADLIIQEFEEGIKDTGITPGVIGEIGMPLFGIDEQEMKVLKASAAAQKRSAARSMSIPRFSKQRPMTYLMLSQRKGQT